jgi:putative ABC transport system permease protein
LLLALALLLGITVVILWVSGVSHRWSAPWAVLRGLLQLTVLGLVLSSVINDVRWVAVALLVMFTVATTTATRRLGFTWFRFLTTALVMAVGTAVALTVIFTSGALANEPRYLLAVGGMVIGNSMSIATLTGRRLLIGLTERWDEVEGWMALGAKPRQSAQTIARTAAGEALIPTIDQTRTTGLVTMPGAFVGSIFGGASPVEAGQFQILVLAAVITAGAITACGMILAQGAVRQKPAILK